MPQSTRVCLDCRARLDPDSACARHPRSAIADLSTPAGREQLRSRIWGTVDVRARAREAAKAGFFGGSLGGLEACVDCGGATPAADLFAVVALVAVAFFLVYLVLAFVFGVVRWYRHRLRPEGAPVVLSAPGGALLTGRVVSAAGALSAPLSDRSCAAYGVSLLRTSACLGGPLFLRDGETSALELELDDGRRVRIPEGRCQVTGPSGRHPKAAVAFYLQKSGLADDPDEEAPHYPLVPADDAKEVLVREGDRVALYAELAPLDGAYRDLTHFTTRGNVELTVLDNEA